MGRRCHTRIAKVGTRRVIDVTVLRLVRNLQHRVNVSPFRIVAL